MFAGCKHIKKIFLPEGLKEISASAFEGCTSLEEVMIPESVQELGKNLFSGVGRDFSIIFGGDSLDFANKVLVKTQLSSHTDGDYHHPSSTHFTPTVYVTNCYESIFGDFADKPFKCVVHCLKDGKELQYSSCSPKGIIEHEVLHY